MFCKHIDTKLRQDGCIDHLALKCYMIGVHGKFAPLSIEIDVDIQKAIRESIIKYYKNTIYQKFNNGSYISNSLEQPLPNIYLPKKYKIGIDKDDISSLSSVDSICSTLSDNSGFTTNSCIECEPDNEIRMIQFKKQCESLIIKNSNKLLPIYKCLVQVQNTNSYSENITKYATWFKDTDELPCVCGILNHDDFMEHLEEMKNNDVYHYFLYDYLVKWDFYK